MHMYIEIKVSHRYWSCKNRNGIKDIYGLSTMKNEYASETSPLFITKECSIHSRLAPLLTLLTTLQSGLSAH